MLLPRAPQRCVCAEPGCAQGVACVFYEVLTLCPLFPGAWRPRPRPALPAYARLGQPGAAPRPAGTNELDQVGKILDVLGAPPPALLAAFARRSQHAVGLRLAPRRGSGLAALAPRLAPAGLDLLGRLLSYDPAARPSAEQALRHPYFRALRRAPALRPRPRAGGHARGRACSGLARLAWRPSWPHRRRSMRGRPAAARQVGGARPRRSGVQRRDCALTLSDARAAGMRRRSCVPRRRRPRSRCGPPPRPRPRRRSPGAARRPRCRRVRRARAPPPRPPARRAPERGARRARRLPHAGSAAGRSAAPGRCVTRRPCTARPLPTCTAAAQRMRCAPSCPWWTGG